MAPRKTKFSDKWLQRSIDVDDEDDSHLVSIWCESCADDEYSAYCKVCDKTFSVANMGFGQVESHAKKSAKHKTRLRSYLKQTVFQFVNSSSKKENSDESATATSSASSSSTIVKLVAKNIEWMPSTFSEKLIKAEGLLLLTAISCNVSFSSIGDLSKIMPIAFHDSEIAKNIKLSDAKARYLTKFGLALYFKQNIFTDLSKSGAFYTLFFDETTTKQVKKQMDVYIGFWSEKYETVVTYYCDSFFWGHANADKILESILNFISENNLKLDHLLQCSMDGPQVNLSFKKKLNSHLATLQIENLVDIGTCSLHTVHNAMKKGIRELNSDVESFVLAVFQWFKMSSARREDYHQIQETLLLENVSEHLFLRHVENRWLTLGPVCERILEQYEVLKEYFLDFLPKANVKASEKYNYITRFLKDFKNVLYLHFIVFISNMFSSYLTAFQKEAPLVHILYSKQNELIRSFMHKFLKYDTVEQKQGLSLLKIQSDDANNWIPLKKIDVGTAVQKILKYPEDKDFLHNVRKCYVQITTYLQKNLTYTNPLLHDLQFIIPQYQNDKKAKDAIGRISEILTKVSQNDKFCDNVKSEFTMLMCEELAREKEIYEKDNNICKYWSAISKKKDALGELKYPSVAKLIKSCLTLSHGNSIPERGFSINKNIVTDERNSLSEVGIKSLRICKDYMKNFQSVSDIVVTKNMINHMKKARAEYASYLEKVKDDKIKEALKRKAEKDEEESILKKKAKEDIKEKLSNLVKTENELLKKQETSYVLLNDATQKLGDAVKNNDFQAIMVAQMMLNAANTSIKEVSEKLASLKKDISNVREQLTK